ncbi:hypothetical protein Bca52824_002467 [Brassica carinata]|uniref:Uncharacterized protein n=1 Tax=Brassica carinata TaxID=52824 RepID=A0A8X8BEW5_BRACI|nr:hypothetical protein Bca52824_002467 [Brassica carinata]
MVLAKYPVGAGSPVKVGVTDLDLVKILTLVSLKMENSKVQGELTPHIYGSVPLPLLHELTSILELSFVVPPDHDFEFQVFFKPKYRNTSCIVEEGQNRLLTGGSLQGDARVALFKLEGDVILEFLVFINADRVSPFDLATRRL